MINVSLKNYIIHILLKHFAFHLNNIISRGCKWIRKNQLNRQTKSNRKKLIIFCLVLKSNWTNENRCILVRFSILIFRTAKPMNRTNDYNYALNLLFYPSLNPKFILLQLFFIFVYIFLLSAKHASRTKLKNIESKDPENLFSLKYCSCRLTLLFW